MIEPDKPVPGTYRMRFVRGGVYVPVLIKYGPPPDPDNPDGPPLDRSWRWMAWVNGRYTQNIWSCWPACSGGPITEQEYHYLLAMKMHAERYEPDLPQADPRKPVDWSKVLPQFDKRG